MKNETHNCKGARFGAFNDLITGHFEKLSNLAVSGE